MQCSTDKNCPAAHRTMFRIAQTSYWINLNWTRSRSLTYLLDYWPNPCDSRLPFYFTPLYLLSPHNLPSYMLMKHNSLTILALAHTSTRSSHLFVKRQLSPSQRTVEPVTSPQTPLAAHTLYPVWHSYINPSPGFVNHKCPTGHDKIITEHKNEVNSFSLYVWHLN